MPLILTLWEYQYTCNNCGLVNLQAKRRLDKGFYKTHRGKKANSDEQIE